MLRNYLIIGFRNLMRNKSYAALNIAGLAVGIAACVLIFAVVRFELSYDTFHRNYSRIYRVVTESRYASGELATNPGAPIPVPVALRQEVPQLEKVAALQTTYGSQITVLGSDPGAGVSPRKFIEELGILFVEPEFFEIFDAQWLAGNPREALAKPNTVVLAKTEAEKYFGNWQQATGQYLKLDNSIPLMVSGIIDDVPGNSDFPFRVLISYETFKSYPNEYGYSTDWGSISSNHQVFVLLPETLSPENVQYALEKFSEKNYQDGRNSKTSNMLQPLRELHFDTRYGNLGSHQVSRSTLWTLSLIGGLILVMAGINFVNLATAQAVSRSKEVGVRKVLGGLRVQLIGQFMAETTLIVVISVLVAVGIAETAMPYLREITNVPEDFRLLQHPAVILFLLLLIGVVSMLAGFYPALVLSGFEPVRALKNKITAQTIGGIPLRRSLVVFQFAISQVLIIGTLVAVSQMDFVRDIELGFSKEAVYVVPVSSDSLSQTKFRTFKNRLLQNPAVASVSLANDPPSSENFWFRNFYFDNSTESPDFSTYVKYADADYFQTYGLTFVAGAPYPESDTTRGFVVNETLLKKLGITDYPSAIGKPLRLGGEAWKPITGVVRDFIAGSVRDEMRPVVIASARPHYYQAGIKIHPQHLQKTVNEIQALWEDTFPDYVYEGHFLDESIARFYEQENKLAQTYKIFAALAIFISCLGLYGLVSFMAVQKTKEIGIRKVLGASVGSIVLLLSREFLLLITLAFAIAAPVAYYLVNRWLENFQYQIPLGVGVFALAIAVSVAVAWITISYRAIRAAIANPVESLRSE